MKGLFIPGITAEMFRNGRLESIEALMAEGEIDDIDYEPEQRWIPCSERLPAVHESGNSFSGIYMQSYPVLVYGVSEYDDKYRFHIAIYCDDLDGNTYWSTEVDAETVNGVTAWMPLPEPFREKGECDV